MDFGIKAAALTGLRVYETASRGSGRTESVLRSLKDGDILMVSDGKEAERLGRILRERKLNVQIVTLEGARYRGHLSGRRGRLVVEHTAYLRLYEEAIARAEAEIRSMSFSVEPSFEDLRPVMSFAFGG